MLSASLLLSSHDQMFSAIRHAQDNVPRCSTIDHSIDCLTSLIDFGHIIEC